jgi:beta-lactamase regulating signal transducer with metallopeptidase domain
MTTMGFNNELIRSLGMTLVHSLWEGLLVLVLVLFAISLAGKSNARCRYVILVAGHLILLAGFIGTWLILYHRNLLSVQTVDHSVASNSQIPLLVNAFSRVPDMAGFSSTVHQFLEPLYPVLALGWMLGFLIMVARMTGGIYLSYRIIRKEVYLPDPYLLEVFEKARAKLLMPAIFQLRLSTRKISPMVIGFLKPCVIVPAAILSGLNNEQVEAILVHELAHIRRFDHVLIIIQAVVTQILFFHPIAWYLSAEINRERENCCDDLVMNSFPNPINYIKALTMIQELNAHGPIPANAITGRSKHLLSRVKRLLKPETKHAPAFRFTVVFLLLITLGITAITIATAGNVGKKTNTAGLLSVVTEKKQAARDTVKSKTDQMEFIKKEYGDQEDHKKKNEITDANRKRQKAQREVERAQEQLEKARHEFEQAREKLKSQDLASMNDDIRRALEDARMQQFRLEHDGAYQEYLNKLHDELGRKHEELQRYAEHFRQADWERIKQEWQRSGEEMKKVMEDFYRSRKDDMPFFHDPHPFFNALPVPPFNPQDIQPVPDIPPVPDLILPVPPNMDEISPEQEHQLEQIQKDQERNDEEKADRLHLKLREAENSKE